MFGIILVLIGVFWLMSSLGIITADIAELFWPIIIIAIGLSIIIRPRRWHRHSDCCTNIGSDENTKKEDE